MDETRSIPRVTGRRYSYFQTLCIEHARLGGKCEVKDVSPSEAESAILGYTIGNDLSCRLFQHPTQNAGQFFYAKAFDKFAPIGPVLVSPEIYRHCQPIRLTTKVSGALMQDADLESDMIFSPAEVLSFMSQSKWAQPLTRCCWGGLLSYPFPPVLMRVQN